VNRTSRRRGPVHANVDVEVILGSQLASADFPWRKVHVRGVGECREYSIPLDKIGEDFPISYGWRQGFVLHTDYVDGVIPTGLFPYIRKLKGRAGEGSEVSFFFTVKFDSLSALKKFHRSYVG